MNTKQFFVSLDYHCEYEPQYDYTQNVGKGFNSFDTAQQFAETIMEKERQFMEKMNTCDVGGQCVPISTSSFGVGSLSESCGCGSE